MGWPLSTINFENITVIPQKAFADCTALKSINALSVQKVSSYAF
jgi:hypothetical protein